MATGTYTDRTTIESKFGADNVSKWADLNGNEVPAEITARITQVIADASQEIEDRLRGGPYTLPFSDFPNTPKTVTDICTQLCGVYLYESRGVEDFNPETGQPIHKLGWHRTRAEKRINMLRTGALQLDLDAPQTCPEVVLESEEEDTTTYF